MVIKIYGNHIEECGTAISVPADAVVEIGHNRIVACGKAIDLREPASLLGALGLSPETPLDKLREVLAFVGEAKHTEPEVAQKASDVGLFKWLSAGADATTVVTGLASLYPYAQSILARLQG